MFLWNVKLRSPWSSMFGSNKNNKNVIFTSKCELYCIVWPIFEWQHIVCCINCIPVQLWMFGSILTVTSGSLDSLLSKPPQCLKFNFIDDFSSPSPPHCLMIIEMEGKRGCNLLPPTVFCCYWGIVFLWLCSFLLFILNKKYFQITDGL